MNFKSFVSGIFKTPLHIILSIQWLLLLILLALIPYAMSFTPFEKIFEVGSYKAKYAEDPLQSHRMFLMLFGFIISFISLLLAIAGLFIKPRNRLRVAAQFGIAIAAMWIGCRTYPYWANGIYQVYTGDLNAGLQYNFDPAGLNIPGIWYLLVLIAYPAMYLGIITLVALSSRYSENEPWYSSCVKVVIVMTVILVLTSILSPGFFTWYID
jgi:hypothetical protein